MKTNMTLEEIRCQIDSIDAEIRKLIMKRLDCSRNVAMAKQASGNLVIYRADREAEILKRLGQGVPEDRKAEYLSVVKKIMETSRMYQYGLLYDWNEGLFSERFGEIDIPAETSHIRFTLTRPNQPNSMAQILSMIGDYGCNIELMELVGEDKENGTVTFTLTIMGNLNEDHMKKLMYQLSMESLDFAIEHVW
jgi:chorismate mutase